MRLSDLGLWAQRWWNDHRSVTVAVLAVPILLLAVLVGRASTGGSPAAAAAPAQDTSTVASTSEQPSAAPTSAAPTAAPTTSAAVATTRPTPQAVVTPEPVEPTAVVTTAPPAVVPAAPVVRHLTVDMDLIQVTSYDATLNEAPQSACQGGHDGFSDIGVGTSVTVKDGAGAIIATGSLTTSTFEEYSRSQSPVAPDDYNTPYSSWPQHTVVDGFCTYSGTVDVPDSAFYSVTVSHRGESAVSRAELEGNNWKLALSLSSS